MEFVEHLAETTAQVTRGLIVVVSCLVLFTGRATAQEPNRTITAADLATLIDIDGLAVSPDGRWAAFQTRRPDPTTNTYSLAWNVTPVGGGPTRRIADGGDPILAGGYAVVGPVVASAPIWSPDSQWITFLRKEDGTTQIWRARADGRRSEQLTFGDRDVRSLVYSADGRRVLFETQPSSTQIAAALSQEGLLGFRYDQRFAPSYSRLPTLPADLPSDSESRMTGTSDSLNALRSIRAVDLVNRRERVATDIEATEFANLTAPPLEDLRYGQFAAASTAGAVAFTEARNPEAQGAFSPLTLVVRDRTQGAVVVCGAPECHGQYMRGVWWRNDEEVLFVRGEGIAFQDRALYSWRVGANSPRLILRSPNLFVSPDDWDCSVAQDQLVCFHEEPTRPRRLVAIDFASGAMTTLYDPNTEFAAFELGTPARVEFSSPIVGTNFGYLVLPPSRPVGPLSLVIVTYRCGGFLRGGTGDEYPIFAFAAQGHAVLCFNLPDLDFVRLSTTGIEDYETWSRGEGDNERRRIQDGLEAAISRLDVMGIIDPERVGITGLSAGGETVMYALFNSPQLAAAIASGTEFGPSSGFLYGPAGRDLLRRWGLHRWDSPRWDSLSITRNAERVRAPLLLNVADHEMIDALQPHMALEEAGRAVEMYVYPDEHHQKSQPAHRLAIYERNIDWMNFWLRGVESDLTGDREQYVRWRSMRQNQCRLFGPNGSERAPGEEPLWYCRPGALEASAPH